MLGRPDEAWEYLKQAQKSNPENPKVYQAIAMLMRMTGAIEQGITYLQLQMTTSPLLINPQVHVTLAELYAAQGTPEAIKTLLDFLKHLPLTLERSQFWLYTEINDADGVEALDNAQKITPSEICAVDRPQNSEGNPNLHTNIISGPLTPTPAVGGLTRLSLKSKDPGFSSTAVPHAG